MDSIVVKTVEMHTGGEPLRIIRSGFPEIKGATILEKRCYVKENLDYMRKFLMFEPRGHYDMYGAIRVEPDLPEADAAFLFMHNEGFSTMCGHAVIALGRYCIDNNIVKYKEPETQVNLQCPCGLVKAYVKCENGQTGAVRFHSVPSFAFKLDLEVCVPKYGRLNVDISYGGAFYGIIPLSNVGLDTNSPIQELKNAATVIANAIKEKIEIMHPDSKDLGYLYGIIFTDTNDFAVGAFNITVFADAQVDRSPCGSGTTARMALLHARGLITVGQTKSFTNPYTKSVFNGEIKEETQCGEHTAVVVEIEGNAYYTGEATFTCEKDDMLRRGFIIA